MDQEQKPINVMGYTLGQTLFFLEEHTDLTETHCAVCNNTGKIHAQTFQNKNIMVDCPKCTNRLPLQRTYQIVEGRIISIEITERSRADHPGTSTVWLSIMKCPAASNALPWKITIDHAGKTFFLTREDVEAEQDRKQQSRRQFASIPITPVTPHRKKPRKAPPKALQED